MTVDPAGMRVFAEPGATLGDIDGKTQEFGLATPTGINSTTGISGLTLGGGLGWLTRQYGMTVDNVLSAEVVTADGEVLIASETENTDLFWALRGGGGNFGIVTRWELRLHPVGDVFAGLVVFPEDERTSVLKQYKEYVPSLPLTTTVWCVMRQAPPLPFLPPEVHGKNVIILPFCHTGDPADDEACLQKLKSFGSPHGVHADDDEFCRQWARDLFEATKPYAAEGVYINFMSGDEIERVKDGFGSNMERLARIKTQYYPRNVFDRNQNIKPA